MTTNPLHHNYRTIWISDTHLGSRGCKSDFLLSFLQHNHAQQLYLVGDIIDGWRLRKRWFWDANHDAIVQTVLDKAQKGTQVTYLSGNHDEFTRNFIGHSISRIELHDEVIHTTADGRKLLVLHGDKFDGVMQFASWLAKLGDWAYTWLLVLNGAYNKVRAALGYPYWSLSAYVKHKTKSAVNFITTFEEVLAREARRLGVDGVVCGHIHHAEIRDIDGIQYCNDGDWVESCTALVEDWDGTMRIIHWTDEQVAQSSRYTAKEYAAVTP